MQPRNVELLYYARHEKPAMTEMGVELVKNLEEFVARCDVVTINILLTDKTRGMFNREIIGKMKKVTHCLINAT